MLAVLVLALHLPYLRLPFHWDEMGQFVPAALDLYRDGAWIPHSTIPNVHPPGISAVVAGVWRFFGYSIPAARLTMLAIASCGVLFSFLLAIRLARGTAGAPAFAAVLFLLASPLFYTQSMMVQLDMPAMTLTALALLLFLDQRYAWCAVVSTALVLVKETSVTTPLVFAVWLWLREAKFRREACYFLAPPIALGAWLVMLHRSTGYWLGNAEFGEYNLAESLTAWHIGGAILVRLWTLFIANGHWLGTVALVAGAQAFRGKDRSAAWTIALWIVLAQVLVVTLLGGAVLDRYLLPVLPVLYAAFAVAASWYPAHWRWASHTAMVALLLVGWFWNPPGPFSFENNLAMVNFVRLQQDGAEYLEATAPRARIASVWPFTAAISRPEFGYVDQPLHAVEARSFQLASLASLNRDDYDVLVVYTRTWPLQGWLDTPAARDFLRRHFNYQPEPEPDQIRNALGLVPRGTYVRQGQRITIYGK